MTSEKLANAATVTLSGPVPSAPSGGAIVTLTSGNPAVAAVPQSITLPVGATTGTFTITTSRVTATTTVAITGSYGGQNRTATLTVTPVDRPGSTVAIGLTLFRPASGQWLVRDSGGQVTTQSPGGSRDLPVRADFLGTGTPQIAVYRPANGEWLIRGTNGNTVRVTFGGPRDVPVPVLPGVRASSAR